MLFIDEVLDFIICWWCVVVVGSDDSKYFFCFWLVFFCDYNNVKVNIKFYNLVC